MYCIVETNGDFFPQEGRNVVVENIITGEELNSEVLLVEPLHEAGIFKVYLRAEEPEYNEIEDPKFNCKFLCIIPIPMV